MLHDHSWLLHHYHVGCILCKYNKVIHVNVFSKQGIKRGSKRQENCLGAVHFYELYKYHFKEGAAKRKMMCNKLRGWVIKARLL